MREKKLERKSANHAFFGRWNIYEMDLWDEKYCDKEEQSDIQISSGNKGSFTLGLVKGEFVDGYVGNWLCRKFRKKRAIFLYLGKLL